MKRISVLIGLIVLGCFISGCVTLPADVPNKMNELKFEKTPQYVLDLSKIKIPENPKILYGRLLKDGKTMEFVTDPNTATHVLFTPSEFSKVVATLEITATYKDLLHDHAKLVNTYIEEINSLKEIAELERVKAKSYREMWVDSERAFKNEKAFRKSQNILNKAGMVLVGGGAVALFAFAL